jgi:hypothetical protein
MPSLSHPLARPAGLPAISSITSRKVSPVRIRSQFYGLNRG